MQQQWHKRKKIAKRKFKQSVEITQEKNNLLSKKEERRVTNGVWNTTITKSQIN